MHQILLIVNKGWKSKKMFDGLEELTLQVSYFIPFKSCFKGFSVIKCLMYLALKLPRFVTLRYVVCLFLWFNEQKSIQNIVKRMMWSFLRKKLPPRGNLLA